MTLEGALGFYLIILIFALTPGPGIFALIARVMGDGMAVCVPLGLGMCVGDLIYLLLACFGLSALATNWGDAVLYVRTIGAVYLIYLGIKMWTADVDKQSLRADSRPQGWLASLLQGALISISNPKVILFYAAFLPSLLDLSDLTTAGVATAMLLTVMAVMSAILMVAYATVSLKRRLQSTRAQSRLNRVSGGIMFGAGVYLGLRG